METKAKSSHHSRSTAVTVKSDLLECLRVNKLCHILPTSPLKPDTFDVYRPKPKTVLDYHISQTDLKIERQLRIGVQKIHLAETRADYVLPPLDYVWAPDPVPPAEPQPPKVQYSSGRGPVWQFADDIRRMKIAAKQKIYEDRLKQHMLERRKADHQKSKGEHAEAVARVGPEWYQELSPAQLNAVDKLKSAIVKDVRNQTIENTQDIISVLGLVLRPNPRHIKIALKKCCECPVEFLLLLYQLMNRNRTKYSLNDRLLLSGVVHLTMRETLKELHIRIPSPPRPPKKIVRIPRTKNERTEYTSPYLVPFTYKPCPLKHTGIYKNNHRQYPESPYFDYLDELVTENYEEPATPLVIPDFDPLLVPEGEEYIKIEVISAQRIYNNLVTFRPVPRLHKPSIYIPCDHNLKLNVSESSNQKKWGENDELDGEASGDEQEGDGSTENPNSLSVYVTLKVTTDYECCKPIKKTYQLNLAIDESAPNKTYSSEERDGSQTTTEESLGTDDETVDNSVARNQGPMSYTSDVDEPDSEIKNNTEVNLENEELDNSHVDRMIYIPPDRQSCVQDDKLVEVGPRDSNECKCKEEVERQVQAHLCMCDRCKADRVAKNISEEPQCECMTQYQERVKLYEEMKKRFEVQQNLQTLDQQYILGGVTTTATGEPVYMISSVVPKYECSCALKYNKYLEEQHRLANMPNIPVGKQKYVISGVHESDQGNVYVVSGAVATEDCKCMQIFKQFKERHSTCVDTYNQYLKKIEMDHRDYLHDVAPASGTEIISQQRPSLPEESNIEMQQSEGIQDQEGNSDENEEEPPAFYAQSAEAVEHELNEQEHSAEIQVNLEGGEAKLEPKSCTCKPATNTKTCPSMPAAPQTCSCMPPAVPNICSCVPPPANKCTCMPAGPNTCICMSVPSNKTGDGEPFCGCRPPKVVCVCEPEPVCDCVEEEEEPICYCEDESSTSEELPIIGVPVKRYTILEKIPCIVKEQREILQKALAVMAEDDYPLAKLPDCHKLPHFKLWMQLRCGKYWTMEDRMKLLLRSKKMWRHTDLCSTSTRIPKLNARRKYTWFNAKEVRKLVRAVDDEYYRSIRQVSVNCGREYFPTTFSYEFPTPTFRDVYFSYMPGREGDVICWKPWYQHEVKSARK